jgi:ATP-dependent Clp endopeptidase proteolytic subunit ClpP
MRNWFTMSKVEDDSEEEDDKKNPFAEILIYDAIGKSFWDDDAVSAQSFVTALADLGDVAEIKLRINSPGGDVFDGVAIYNAVKNHKAKVTAHVDGIAASAASLIAMAADKIVMPSNAFMLIHQSAGFSMGNAEDMIALAADLQRIDKSMAATYAARSGQPASKVRALMKEDRLMDATEAKSLGYADEIASPVKMAASMRLNVLPPKVAEKFRAETGTEQGDPPQSAPGPQEPGQPVPATPAPTNPEHPAHEPAETPPVTRPGEPDPAPTPGTPRSAEVIDIKAVKQQGVDEHKAYVQAITDLCTLARAPEKVGAYVRAGTSADQVRKELLAKAAEQPVLSQHPAVPPAPPAKAWDKITDKINARVKK